MKTKIKTIKFKKAFKIIEKVFLLIFPIVVAVYTMAVTHNTRWEYRAVVAIVSAVSMSFILLKKSEVCFSIILGFNCYLGITSFKFINLYGKEVMTVLILVEILFVLYGLIALLRLFHKYSIITMSTAILGTIVLLFSTKNIYLAVIISMFVVLASALALEATMSESNVEKRSSEANECVNESI